MCDYRWTGSAVTCVALWVGLCYCFSSVSLFPKLKINTVHLCQTGEETPAATGRILLTRVRHWAADHFHGASV